MMRLAATCFAMVLSGCAGNSTFDDAHLMLNSVLDGACNQPSFKRPLQRHEYGTYSKEMMVLRGTCQSIAPLLPHNY